LACQHVYAIFPLGCKALLLLESTFFTQLREEWTTTSRFGPGKLTSMTRNLISADRQRVQKDDFQGIHGKELQNRAKITAKM